MAAGNRTDAIAHRAAMPEGVDCTIDRGQTLRLLLSNYIIRDRQQSRRESVEFSAARE
jgi:hypothetical protein